MPLKERARRGSNGGNGFYLNLSRSLMEMIDVLKEDYFTPEKQEARCFLRERFLRAVTGIVGKECTFHMHQNTTVSGIFKGSDIEFRNILVDQLKTPLAEIPHSILRSNDINYITFDKIDKQGDSTDKVN